MFNCSNVWVRRPGVSHTPTSKRQLWRSAEVCRRHHCARMWHKYLRSDMVQRWILLFGFVGYGIGLCLCFLFTPYMFFCCCFLTFIYLYLFRNVDICRKSKLPFDLFCIILDIKLLISDNQPRPKEGYGTFQTLLPPLLFHPSPRYD